MSIILKETRKQEIHWLLSWNVGDEANDKLTYLLGQLSSHFAKNKIKSGGYVWEASNEDWKPFLLASETDQKRIREEYSLLSVKVTEALNKKIDPSSVQSLVNRIMTIPNADYIYYRIDENEINILLTAWGFKNNRNPIVVPPKRYVEDNDNTIRIGFMNSNAILPNHPFAILKQTVNELQTGEDGFFVLGNKVNYGTEFKIESRVTGEQFQFTVIKEQSDYIFNITMPESEVEDSEPIISTSDIANISDDENTETDIPTSEAMRPDSIEEDSNETIHDDSSNNQPLDVTIQLLNQKGNPIPQSKMLLRNHKGKKLVSVTNEDGCIVAPYHFFTDKKKIKVSPQIKNVKPCKFKYTASCNFYVIELKDIRRRKFPWWILLLFLLLLLLVRCEHDIKVTCLDEKTGSPIENVDISLDYIAHFLYDDGEFFVNKEHHYLQYTDETGCTIFKDLECSVFSYLFYCFSKVLIVAEENSEYSGFFHFTRHVVFNLENIDCDVDIAMCIDNTGSMLPFLNMVKNNAINFHSDLTKYSKMKRRNIKNIRIKVISFGDLRETQIKESVMFSIPKDIKPFNDYVKNINCFGGIDAPENGLEALAMAINTDWVKTDIRHRHIILLYTDASAHELGLVSFDSPNTPKTFDELENRWNCMDENAKRLVLFAPNCYPWNNIAKSWDKVVHKTENLNILLSGKGYEEILEAICKSL